MLEVKRVLKIISFNPFVLQIEKCGPREVICPNLPLDLGLQLLSPTPTEVSDLATH